ncbi:MAG: periplasmic heavy metal sensor [Myxococcota bacterium]
MKLTPVHAVLLILLAFVAGGLGASATRLWRADRVERSGMHEFVHRELRLSKDQSTRLDALERDFAIDQRKLDLALRTANADLARAIDEEGHYGSKVGAAIEEVHLRMGELQKATVRHVFEMRGLLEPEQQRAFDREVRRALTHDPKN